MAPPDSGLVTPGRGARANDAPRPALAGSGGSTGAGFPRSPRTLPNAAHKPQQRSLAWRVLEDAGAHSRVAGGCQGWLQTLCGTGGGAHGSLER